MPSLVRPLPRRSLGSAQPALDPREPSIDLLDIEVGWIERTSCPVEVMCVGFVFRVGNRFKELLIAGGAPDILWRTLTGSGHASKDGLTHVVPKDLFNYDLMHPVITHVIDIKNALAGHTDRIFQKCRLCELRWRLKDIILSATRTASRLDLFEFEQVFAPPPHRALDNLMKPGQADVVGDEQAAPDHGLDISK